LKKIGITTTVPIEVLMAAGYIPVDLNNLFISDPNPERLVTIAERAGFPLNCCSWIKGIYGTCLDENIDTVLCVTTGDCSNTVMLMEVLRLKGVKVIPFAYPDQPDTYRMQDALEALASTMGTTLAAAGEYRTRLAPYRRLALKLDEFTWKLGLVTGWENHLWLVSTSDFNEDTDQYQRELQDLLDKSRKRHAHPREELRLGYIGVPSVFGRDLYPYLEDRGARVIYNEVQRQFAMPEPGDSLASQYANYTYPYSIHDRIRDIQAQIELRHLDGVIHYVQAFCHRGIGDIIFRHDLKIPVLTLEGNNDYFLTSHVKTKLEAFIDMLGHSQRRLITAEEV
jgi:benzoyl-CoA reductase/2-hydroxyglutaryl-CoA dehydratase subunit BcrC/BadD/HgdB